MIFSAEVALLDLVELWLVAYLCQQNWLSKWSELSLTILLRLLTSQRGKWMILLERNTAGSLVTGSDSPFPPPWTVEGRNDA